MTTVYRIVRRTRMGSLLSVLMPRSSKLQVRYYPNKERMAPKDTKLTAFKTLWAAQRFLLSLILYSEHTNFEIWEAQTRKALAVHHILYPHRPGGGISLTLARVQPFWAIPDNWRRKQAGWQVPPTGTVACDSITLIKRVDNGGSHDE